MKQPNQFRLKALIVAIAATFATVGCGSSDHEVHDLSSSEDCNFPEHRSQINSIAPAADVIAQPTFHRLPIELSEPPTIAKAPLEVDSSTIVDVDTKNLTEDKLLNYLNSSDPHITRKSTNRKPIVYNPAQIREAYGLPEIPQDLSKLTPEQAASLGAGQTIYIIVGFDNPSLVSDLDQFSKKFNLPTCNELKLPAVVKPLPAANNNCTVSVVHSTAGAGLSDKKPGYDSTWALESSLDVQWAHAVAPLARKVVIQARNALVSSLADAVRVANSFGTGVVSMSFVAKEASFVRGSESIFAQPGMTYIAAAGDYGYQANWPAVSPSVISVGGTTLSGYSSGGRNESAWKGTGGGFSSQFPMPAWQAGLKFAANAPKTRVGTDLSFNADPYTGQYIAYSKLGAKTPAWLSIGGTSLGTPQIAGIIAVVNAQRALLGKQPIGKFHQSLYSDLGPGLGASAQAFNDVTTGSNGVCSWCSTKYSYDIPTGWGTPNANRFIPLLVNK